MNSWTSNFDRLWPRQHSVWDEINQLLEEDQLKRAGGSDFPKVNLYQNADTIILTAEVPGVDPDFFEIMVNDLQISLSGEICARTRSEHELFHRCERITGKFHRELRLPHRVDTAQASAICRDGILKVSLPKLTEATPQRISISPI